MPELTKEERDEMRRFADTAQALWGCVRLKYSQVQSLLDAADERDRLREEVAAWNKAVSELPNIRFAYVAGAPSMMVSNAVAQAALEVRKRQAEILSTPPTP